MSARREFHFSQGASHEFWAITLDGATHRVTGDLTIHGRTHRVSFPATVQIRDDVVTAAAEFSIDRRDFDITYKGMADDLIKHDVLLDLSLRFGRGA